MRRIPASGRHLLFLVLALTGRRLEADDSVPELTVIPPVAGRIESEARGAERAERAGAGASPSLRLVEAPRGGVRPIDEAWLPPSWRDEVRRIQFVPDPGLPPAEESERFEPLPGGGSVPVSSIVADPPLFYGGPPTDTVEDMESRDGPHIPEPMVFDLVRGLGARRGELEVNVLNLVPTRRGRKPVYEWAPEIEYALFDGFALEFELPIYNTTIQDLKFGAQYTFGTAFDDAFIHGTQGLLQYNFEQSRWTPTALYLAGMRLNRTWSMFGMFGFSVGPQIFPFDDIPDQDGTDLITNLSIFADVTDRLVLGVETNLSRSLRGPGEFFIIPQLHYQMSERTRVQLGYGLRDDGPERFGELGFRFILER